VKVPPAATTVPRWGLGRPQNNGPRQLVKEYLPTGRREGGIVDLCDEAQDEIVGETCRPAGAQDAKASAPAK
jgi:hypothetical protein